MELEWRLRESGGSGGSGGQQREELNKDKGWAITGHEMGQGTRDRDRGRGTRGRG